MSPAACLKGLSCLTSRMSFGFDTLLLLPRPPSTASAYPAPTAPAGHDSEDDNTGEVRLVATVGVCIERKYCIGHLFPQSLMACGNNIYDIGSQ